MNMRRDECTNHEHGKIHESTASSSQAPFGDAVMVG